MSTFEEPRQQHRNAGRSEAAATNDTNAGGATKSVRLPRRARRAQLLTAALEVFVAQGYHAAAMDDIAERAGVSKPVLYQHFPGKLELYLALLDQSCDTIISSCAKALESTEDNKQRVAATMHAFYAYVSSAEGAFRLVFESDLTNEPAVRARVDRVTVECAKLIAHVIADDTGLPEEASQLLAVSLVGMGQVSARFWLQEGGALNQDEAATLISGLAWRGIRGYPRTDETR
ncbi:MAG: transcriptional regulator, TetR family [Marmoricola sp.]|nr:transcriptional regulator, TetR family [Marmoricola sp.]